MSLPATGFQLGPIRLPQGWQFAGLISAIALGLALQAYRGSPLGIVALVVVLLFAAAIEIPALGTIPLIVTMASVRLGAMSANVGGVPLTASKLAMGGLIAVVVSRWVTGRHRAQPFHALTLPMAAVLGSMTFAYFVRVEEDIGDVGRIGLLTAWMLVIMVHVVPLAVDAFAIRRVGAFFAVTMWLAVVVAPFVALADSDERRTEGWFGDPNQLCSMVLLSTLTALGVATAVTSTWQRRALSVLVAASAPFVVLQTGSRGGFIMILACAPLYLRMVRKDVGVLVLTVPLALLAAAWNSNDLEYLMTRYNALWSEQVWGPETGEGVDSIEGRMLFQRLAWNEFLAHPLSGIGLGGFHAVSMDYFPGMSPRDTHNSISKFTVEQGLVGVVTHSWLAWSLFRMVRETLSRPIPPWHYQMVLGASFGIVGWTLMNLTIGDLMQNAIAWFVIGLLVILHRASELQPETPA